MHRVGCVRRRALRRRSSSERPTAPALAPRNANSHRRIMPNGSEAVLGRCRYVRTRSWGSAGDCDRLPGDGAVGFPVRVERALDLEEPDDGPDERDQIPESRETADGLLLSLGGVHVADLRRQQEQVDDVDQNLDDQSDNGTNALAGVLLELPEDLVGPVERVDADRDDRKDDHRPRIADLANWSHATPHLFGLHSGRTQETLRRRASGCFNAPDATRLMVCTFREHLV